jgi:hypothetical protein
MAMHINPEHKGLFHKKMGIPQDKKVPASAVSKGLQSKDATTRKEANFARMAKRHFKPL